MTTISLPIGGERRQAEGGAYFERCNPLDGSVATTAPAASIVDAIAAVGCRIARRSRMVSVGSCVPGRFGGKAGVAEFTDLRWVTMQTTPRHYPF